MAEKEKDRTNEELKSELIHALFMFRNLHFHRFGGKKIGLMSGIGRGIMTGEFWVSMPAFALLKQLQIRESRGETGGAWLSEMRDYLCVSKAAVSQMLGTLESRGLITRETDPENRRTIIVRLTTEGRETIKRFEQGFDGHIGMVIERVGEKDTRELIRLINRITDIIGEIADESEDEAE